ncbi:MAG: PD40 domain-containing protein, partial [Planctomycetaceae bacterium]|nr:PD40 domain-containing protein [Planctomycetaceae bacterium]
DSESGQVTNLGVDHASYGWSPGSHHLAVLVVEAGQGNTPLNGDGDADDQVLHVYNALSGNLVNVGLVVSNFWRWSPTAGQIVFDVNEGEQGDGDLIEENRIGASADVVHVYDAWNETTRNLEVEQFGLVWSPDGQKLAVIAHETEVAIDHNNDGDVHDFVPHIYHATSGAFTNTQYTGHDPVWSPDSQRLTFIASEWMWMDLNGDLDTNDDVLHLMDANTATFISLGVDARVPDDGWSPDSRYFVTLVSERGEGVDFNGDGDTLDNPVNIYDTVGGSLTSTGFPRSAGESAWNASSTAHAIKVSEGSHSADLNADGDQSDRVLLISSAGGGFVNNLQLAVDLWEWSPDGRFLVFQVDEADQGEDFNNDGDTNDFVLHVYDHDHALVTNLELDGSLGWDWSPDGRHLAFRVDESDQGADLNADSDTDDDVLHFYDPVTRTIDNTGLPALGDLQDQWNATSELFKFLVPESNAGVDLNGDGDAFDPVLHLAQFEPVSNQPPQAQADAFDADEIAGVLGNLLSDNGQGPDSDPDGDPLSVLSVEGQAIAPGQTVLITLASGARLRVGSDGQFTYDPNGAFDLDPGETAQEQFSYTIRDAADATSTAQVVITVHNSALTITGNTATLTGTDGDDFIVHRIGSRRVKINGVSFTLPEHIDTIEIDALAGNDTLNLIGTSGDESGLTRPGTVFFEHDATHAGFDFTAVNVEIAILDGNGGNDTLTLRDPTAPGDDKFFTRPHSAVMFAADGSYQSNAFGFMTTGIFNAG